MNDQTITFCLTLFCLAGMFGGLSVGWIATLIAGAPLTEDGANSFHFPCQPEKSVGSFLQGARKNLVFSLPSPPFPVPAR